MSIAPQILDIACDVGPDQATLVPEKRQELTTEGGLDVAGNADRIKKAVDRLEKNNVPVSLFIDPDRDQIRASKRTGARFIELHTGRYAGAKSAAEQAGYLKELIEADKYARSLGLEVFAGHGLNYNNVAPVAQISGIKELNIGHSIICRAALVGLERAVKEMKALIQ